MSTATVTAASSTLSVASSAVVFANWDAASLAAVVAAFSALLAGRP